MADRWNEDRDYEGRYRSRGRDDGADTYEGREGRSFNPRGGPERGPDRGPGGQDRGPGRGRVFGERETGASYTGPRYGAGGYTGYGERSVNERGYGSPNYSTGRDDRDFSASSGGYGADLYQERGGQDRGGRAAPRGYDRAQDDHWTFGFGYDPEPGAPAPSRAGRDHEDPYGHRDAGFRDKARRFFGGGQTHDHDAETHRGRGPQGYRRSDERISDDVHDRLTEDPHIDASAIVASVQDGEVTLTGTVTSRHAKHHAEHIVEDLAGVKHVQNNLRVQDLSASRGASTGQATPLGENSKLSDQAAGKA